MGCESIVSADYLKLTSYFAERERAGSRFLADSMLDLFAERDVAGSVMLRGIAGFGHRGFIRTDEKLALSEDPSVTIEVIDTAETMGAIADAVAGMTSSGLITLERVVMVEDDSAALSLPDGDDQIKLTMYIGRSRRIDGSPAFYAICDLLHRHHFAGATALLGVDGTSHRTRRRAHFFGRNLDVPLAIIAVGSVANIRDVMPALAAMPHRPLITFERIQVCKRDGQVVARPAVLPAHDAQGRPLWQKLMVHTSESTRHDGVPIHRALVRRLWESQATSGATVLRGIWGFHGDHEPHGDKLIQFGRQVPVTTIIVDTPHGIARSFEIVDELTGTHGLVTCETVPALIALGADGRDGTAELADARY
jgi:PII-like signaling protein